MRITTLLVVGLVAALLVADADAARRRGGKRAKSKRKSARVETVQEVEVGAGGEVDELGGFADEPAPAGGGGGKDMSAEFKKYIDCDSCTGAGWGWCPIRRMCGGFANKNCRGDHTDYREDYEPEVEEAAGGEPGWANTEQTTRMWELISSGDEAGLAELIEQAPKVAVARSEDGRGPLFWAHEYEQPKLVALLTRHGADPEARDANGKRPHELPKSFPRPKEERKPAPPAGGGNDMSAEFKKYVDCDSCTGAGWGWCPIRRMCGGFANKNCRGDDTDYRAGHEPEGVSPGVDDDLGGFAAAPRKKAAPAGGDMSAYFASIESCKECLDAGYGWCPIRRRCGGFANKKCRGDDTDMKAA